MSKKPTEMIVDGVSTPVETILKNLTRKHKVQCDDTFNTGKEFLKLLHADKEPDWSEEGGGYDDATRPKYKAFWKELNEVVDSHNDAVEEAENAEKAKKAEAEKEKHAMTVASSQGVALTQAAVVDGAIANIGRGLGENFIVTSLGLKPKKGATITKSELSRAVGFLANGADGAQKVQTSLLWMLADSLNLAKSAFTEGKEFDKDGYDNFIGATVDATNKAEHTIRQAERLGAYFDGSEGHERFAELSATHHQEILNYGNGLKTAAQKKKLAEIVDWARTGGKTVTIENKGKTITQNNPASCADLRKKLQELAGKKPAAAPVDADKQEKEDSASGATTAFVATGYIYVNADAEVFKSGDINEKAVNSGDFVAIINLTTLEVITLSKKGEEIGNAIEDLDETAYGSDDADDDMPE